MKIYTYYEDINYPLQETMLQLWQTSWQKSGFETIILTKKNAQNHNFYELFIQLIKKLHYEIMGQVISPYGLSCYVRWLAYATQPTGTFYVSDYDCINNGLGAEKLSDKLHFMDADCPCFASGTPSQFEKLCFDFIAISLERLEELKALKDQSICYHDQEFFQYNFIKRYNENADDLINKYQILMTRDRINGVGPYDINKKNTCKVLHISYHNATLIKNHSIHFQDDDINEIRIKVMEHIIK